MSVKDDEDGGVVPCCMCPPVVVLEVSVWEIIGVSPNVAMPSSFRRSMTCENDEMD